MGAAANVAHTRIAEGPTSDIRAGTYGVGETGTLTRDR